MHQTADNHAGPVQWSRRQFFEGSILLGSALFWFFLAQLVLICRQQQRSLSKPNWYIRKKNKKVLVTTNCLLSLLSIIRGSTINTYPARVRD